MSNRFFFSLFLFIAVAFAGNVNGGILQSGLELRCLDSISVYTRPCSLSTGFGILLPDDSLTVLVRTSEGWLGFDPGVAQAANIGSLRYRWIDPDGPFFLNGDPDSLPVVWGPSAGVVYAMIPESLQVLAAPDSTAEVIDTLSAGSVAAILQRSSRWVLVDPEQGCPGSGHRGWISLEGVSVSGELESVEECPEE